MTKKQLSLTCNQSFIGLYEISYTMEIGYTMTTTKTTCIVIIGI